MKQLIAKLLPTLDPIIAALAIPAGALLKLVRKLGVQRFPLTKKALSAIGVFPIQDHYYEPRITFDFKRPLSDDRHLPGINFNHDEQIRLLSQMRYGDEFKRLLSENPKMFDFNNPNFGSGDAEFWYNIIRHFKPKRIIEVGSGYSTLVAIEAVKQNQRENDAHRCKHICIEPFEMPWLEQTGVEVKRQKVEDVELEFFDMLGENDILFIDSSHVIRPQGDVLFEYLELLPCLRKGVIVHIHDIFTPKDYLKEWIVDDVRLWNEQYLLEAFLTTNPEWKILAAVNYLRHKAFDQLQRACPFLTPDREPGSFYIQKIA